MTNASPEFAIRISENDSHAVCEVVGCCEEVGSVDETILMSGVSQ